MKQNAAADIATDIAIDIAILLVATAATYFAQSLERPITAVLIYLTGVILIAVRSGLQRGLLGAIAASIAYNFFLSAPVFEFGVTTADEAVPLLAFNVTALVAGTVVGRLRDSATRARSAQAETAFLLTVSDRLQRALKVEEVEHAIRSILPTQGVTSVKLFMARGDIYVRPSTGEIETDRLKPLVEETGGDSGTRRSVVVELEGARGSLGIVRFELAPRAGSKFALPDLQSIAALPALALERCLLLEEVAEAQINARSEALKDALLSSVSHDLRTPITVIEAAAGALASTQISLPEAERTTLLETIVDQCHRLDRYTSELLDVGRIQAGIPQASLRTVDFAEIVQLAARHATNLYPALALDRRVPGDPVLVMANGAMLEQAIFNVLDNAQKFAGTDGPVTLHLERDGRAAILSIADRGPGIPPDYRRRVFDRFFKHEGHSSRRGTGLGLFIAKGFVDAFGGTIEIVSPLEEGGGTRVTITLPLADDPTLQPEDTGA